jgi:hypothetical protein
MNEASSPGRRWPWILVVVVAVGTLLSVIYPLLYEPQNRLLSALMIVASVVAIAIAVGPLRRGRGTQPAMWLLPAGLVVVAAVTGSSADTAFTVVFSLLAVATGIGLWFSRPGDVGAG